jgi:hypothetical protein
VQVVEKRTKRAKQRAARRARCHQAKERAIQQAALWGRPQQEKETSDSASGAAGKASARERNERCRERRGGEDIGMRKKRTVQRAARRGAQDVGKRRKRAIQRAARPLRHQQEKETSDATSGAAGKTSARERNERFSERRSRWGVGGRKKRAMQRAAPRARRRQLLVA